jgi:hypothetical protein
MVRVHLNHRLPYLTKFLEFITNLMRSVQHILTNKNEGHPSIRAKYENFKHFFQNPIVRLNIWESNPSQPRDLVSALLAEFTNTPTGEMTEDAYLPRPKEIVMIQLQRSSSFESGNGERGERIRFSYPANMYIDPFLLELKDLTSVKREQQKQMLQQVEKLQQRKKALTSFEVSPLWAHKYILPSSRNG